MCWRHLVSPNVVLPEAPSTTGTFNSQEPHSLPSTALLVVPFGTHGREEGSKGSDNPYCLRHWTWTQTQMQDYCR